MTAADSVANSTSQSVTYTIAYNVCLQYDPSTAAPAGSVVPIRIKLCDAKAIDMGSRNITVTAVNVSPFGGAASPGNSNSGGIFTFLEAGGYQFLLDTSGYTPGAYALNFVATGDPITHQALFQLK